MAYAWCADWTDIEKLLEEDAPSVRCRPCGCFRLSSDERVATLVIKDRMGIEAQKEELARYLDKEYGVGERRLPAPVERYEAEVNWRRDKGLEEPFEALGPVGPMVYQAPINAIAPYATELIEPPEITPPTAEKITEMQEWYEKTVREAKERAGEKVKEERRERAEVFERDRIAREARLEEERLRLEPPLGPEEFKKELERRRVIAAREREKRAEATKTMRKSFAKLERRLAEREEREVKAGFEAARARRKALEA